MPGARSKAGRSVRLSRELLIDTVGEEAAVRLMRLFPNRRIPKTLATYCRNEEIRRYVRRTMDFEGAADRWGLSVDYIRRLAFPNKKRTNNAA